MPVVYRIIKYEAETQAALDHQLSKSIAPGFVCKPNPEITITIKDRNDDPNEYGFFDSCTPSPVNGMITKEQFDKLPKPV
jgi:hypothetical protein